MTLQHKSGWLVLHDNMTCSDCVNNPNYQSCFSIRLSLCNQMYRYISGHPQLRLICPSHTYLPWPMNELSLYTQISINAPSLGLNVKFHHALCTSPMAILAIGYPRIPEINSSLSSSLCRMMGGDKFFLSVLQLLHVHNFVLFEQPFMYWTIILIILYILQFVVMQTIVRRDSLIIILQTITMS